MLLTRRQLLLTITLAMPIGLGAQALRADRGPLDHRPGAYVAPAGIRLEQSRTPRGPAPVLADSSRRRQTVWIGAVVGALAGAGAAAWSCRNSDCNTVSPIVLWAGGGAAVGAVIGLLVGPERSRASVHSR